MQTARTTKFDQTKSISSQQNFIVYRYSQKINKIVFPYARVKIVFFFSHERVLFLQDANKSNDNKTTIILNAAGCCIDVALCRATCSLQQFVLNTCLDGSPIQPHWHFSTEPVTFAFKKFTLKILEARFR